MLGFLCGRDLVSGVKKGLRRNAAAIEADAAEAFVLFDEDDFLAQVSGVERGRVSAGSGADNDDLGLGWVNVHWLFLLVLVLVLDSLGR